MALNHSINGGFQQEQVRFVIQLHQIRDMIDTAPLLKLFDKPHPLLGKRQGVARQLNMGDHRAGLLPHLCGQPGNSFQLKHLY